MDGPALLKIAILVALLFVAIWLRRAALRNRGNAVSVWFVVTFDAEQITLEVSPPGAHPWSAEIQWGSITRVCFQAEDFGASDGIYIFVAGREESYAIPIEGKGGGELWDEIVDRKLFDAELAIKAMSATEGLFCWPPEEESS